MEAKDLRQKARENLSGNWALSIGVAVVAWLLGGLMVGSSFIPEINYTLEGEHINLKDWLNTAMTFSQNFGGLTLSTTGLGLAQFIIGGVIELGYARYLLKQYDRQDFQFGDLFSQFERFGQGFAQHFLRSLYTFLWGLLFVIPGIMKGYSYAMTPYLMIDNPQMSASEAINASKEMMDGHKADLFWLDLTFFGWNMLAILTMNIGNIALNPYKNAARAAFYRDLCIQRYRARYEQV